MLRISLVTTEDTAEPQCLRLDGQVTGPWVEELRRTCAETVGNNRDAETYLVLDLAGVSFLDAAGVALFRDLTSQHVAFANFSAFIAEQLRGVVNGNA
jgi:anti-anti-sigma regulatory factor